jgi:hypothetical protein
VSWEMGGGGVRRDGLGGGREERVEGGGEEAALGWVEGIPCVDGSSPSRGRGGGVKMGEETQARRFLGVGGERKD